MNIQPTLDIHTEFALAENTDSHGCFCCWRSNARPREYMVNENHELVGKRRVKYRERIIANQRLSEMIKIKFKDDPIEQDKAFELLKARINDNLENGDPLTSEKLVRIINAISELKKDIYKDKKREQ